MTIKNLSTGFLLVFLLFVFNYAVKAQNVPVRKIDSVGVRRAQNVFIELGAAGLFFSANYDIRFSQQRDGLGGRLGIGTWTHSGTTFVTVPLQVNYLLGGKSSFLEAGAGATLLTLNNPYPGNPLVGKHFTVPNSTVLPTATIGYRYQPFKHGINFRANFDPMLLEGAFIPYFGLSAGYTFK